MGRKAQRCEGPAEDRATEGQSQTALACQYSRHCFPREIFSFIQQVPVGSVATIADLQSAVARKHGAELGCPLTTGIFTWIAANASEELEAKLPGSGAPYWRILKSDGSLNPKFPGGVKSQAKHLAQEGVLCEKRGAKMRVARLENIHFHF